MVYVTSLIQYLPHIRIDIDKDVVKFNGKELDNKSRKNVARDLRYLLPESLYYRFNKGIAIKGDEKLVITVLGDDIKNVRKVETDNRTDDTTDSVETGSVETGSVDNVKVINIGEVEIERKRHKHKDSYKNVWLSYNIRCGEEEHYLKEGCRYLSHEEMSHIIDLIHKPEGTIFELDVYLYSLYNSYRMQPAEPLIISRTFNMSKDEM